jgi:hypothetical protein
MLSLSENSQDIILAFNNTSSYLDDIFNLDNSYFDQMVYNIHPNELQLNPFAARGYCFIDHLFARGFSKELLYN